MEIVQYYIIVNKWKQFGWICCTCSELSHLTAPYFPRCASLLLLWVLRTLLVYWYRSLNSLSPNFYVCIMKIKVNVGYWECGSNLKNIEKLGCKLWSFLVFQGGRVNSYLWSKTEPTWSPFEMWSVWNSDRKLAITFEKCEKCYNITPFKDILQMQKWGNCILYLWI